jgi:hypothetical protein
MLVTQTIDIHVMKNGTAKYVLKTFVLTDICKNILSCKLSSGHNFGFTNLFGLANLWSGNFLGAGSQTFSITKL